MLKSATIFENYTNLEDINETNWTIKYSLQVEYPGFDTFANITGHCKDNESEWVEVFNKFEDNTSNQEIIFTENYLLQESCFNGKEKIETKVLMLANGWASGRAIAKYYESNITWTTFITNITTIESGLTSKTEWWNISLKIFDGEDWSLINNSQNITIQNTPALWNTIDNQSLDEDGSIEINLSNYTFDPDEDSLTFEYTPVQNITITIIDGIANLTPDNNFSGTRWIIFLRFLSFSIFISDLEANFFRFAISC